ncbi:MAG: hypothetical protein ACK4RK_12555 [Gemmataceae bacterium]
MKTLQMWKGRAIFAVDWDWGETASILLSGKNSKYRLAELPDYGILG